MDYIDTVEENKKRVKDLVESYDQKELDKALARYPAFSDFKVKVKEQIAIGNRVVSRWVLTAKHTDVFLGIPATGKEITLLGISIHRVDHHKIIEDALEIDINDLVQQLSS